jgi:tRNA dimethylallyltransferase
MDARFEGVPLLVLERDRSGLYRRIDARVEAMVESGWVEEARRLAAKPGWKNFPAANSLGYPEMTAVAEGALGIEEAIRRIQKQTRNYAKRQITFFGHQFPAIRPWQAEALTGSLEKCGWNWESFKATLTP